MMRTDEQLCDEARAGSQEAFSLLWKRHVDEAIGYARKLNPAIAEDAVSDAMVSVFEALQQGKGPSTSFRSYLLLSVRNRVYRESRIQPSLELPDEQQLEAPEEPSILERSEDAQTVHQALQQLPERWRRALILSEVQGQSLAHIGAELGLQANAVSALLKRARAGLRRSWVAAHFAGAKLGSECANVVDALGEFRWGKPSERQRHWFERHVADCAECSERQGAHAWLAQAVGLALLPLVWIGASRRAEKSTASPTHLRGVRPAGNLVGTIVTAGVAVTALTAVAIPALLFEPRVGAESRGNGGPTGEVNTSAPVEADLQRASHSADQEGSVVATGTSESASLAMTPGSTSGDTAAEATAPLTPLDAQATLPQPVSPSTAPPTGATQPSGGTLVEPIPPAAWNEHIIGSTRPGATLEFVLSDSSRVTTIADSLGDFAVSIAWSATKPVFGYTLQRVSQ